MIDFVLRLTQSTQGDKLTELCSELVLEGDNEEVNPLDLVVLQFVPVLAILVLSSSSLLTRSRHATSATWVYSSPSTHSSCLSTTCTSSSRLVSLNYTEEQLSCQ